MSTLPALVTEQDVHAAVERLAAIDPGSYWVVTCYLKLEPRDRSRGKYLIKMKNRVKGAAAALSTQSLGHADREAIAADLQRVLDYLEEPNHLPGTRAIAIFASQGLDLFETLPLPHVHRSRLAVDHEPLVRELVALDEEFGTILVVVYDRTAVRQRGRAQLPHAHSHRETAVLRADRGPGFQYSSRAAARGAAHRRRWSRRRRRHPPPSHLPARSRDGRGQAQSQDGDEGGSARCGAGAARGAGTRLGTRPRGSRERGRPGRMGRERRVSNAQGPVTRPGTNPVGRRPGRRSANRWGGRGCVAAA